MKLDDLVEHLDIEHIDHSGREDIDVSCIISDSRKSVADAMFLVTQGIKCDGADFILRAVEQGVCVVVTENRKHVEIYKGNIYWLIVPCVHTFMKDVSLKFFGDPSQQLNIIGITGTNGKTTITYLMESIFREAEYLSGVIGTVNYRMGEKVLKAVNTTPGFLDLQKILHDMCDYNLQYCVMEVSSHALDQSRVAGVNFTTAIFSNLTDDHLDYHQTKEKYFLAKTRLFSELSEDSVSVINADDIYGRKLLSKTESKICTYGIDGMADVMAEDIQIDIDGSQFKLKTPQGEIVIRSSLVGIYNVYNMLAASAACLVQGVSLQKIKRGLENLKNVPGRLEKLSYGQNYSVFIDYAHTDDALQNVLSAVRKTSDAKIILVFGCGGDRDKKKRQAMGHVADQWADYSIVTSDNPRSEVAEDIIEEIVKGFDEGNYIVEVNREKAICMALGMAQKGDIILLTGKGHETYQILGDNVFPFDEKKIVRNFILC